MCQRKVKTSVESTDFGLRRGPQKKSTELLAVMHLTVGGYVLDGCYGFKVMIDTAFPHALRN